ncbi:helix-turn-helix domain-containing protein [Botrimarina sp.]|uniref:helix-turn-helix domain-containing protein n=1 Tax=Botrimarina sp. TaxID=2795802 RepID=UPI0032EF36A9
MTQKKREKPTKEAFTIQETAAKLGVSERFVRDLIKEKELKAYDIRLNKSRGLKKLRISISEIRKYQLVNQDN